MAHILLLPPEILHLIYLTLRNIDDALHLARCCKQLNHIFEYRRLAILKHIIVRCQFQHSIHANAQQQFADHNVHDPSLCYRVRLHDAISREMFTTPDPWDVGQRRAIIRRCLESTKSTSPVTWTEIVWDTVVRWGAMRVLFDLYCDASVQDSYCQSTYLYELDDNEEAVAVDDGGPLLRLSGSACSRFRALDGKQKQRAYERFYKALTTYWAKFKKLWFTRTDAYRNSEHAAEAIESMVTLMVYEPDSRSVQERLDILEVADFVSTFLGRKALQMMSSADWVAARGYDLYYDMGFTPEINWVISRRVILDHSRPGNIIELVLASQWASHGHWPLDRAAYLDRLGVMDLNHDYEDGGTMEKEMPRLVHLLEESVEQGLVGLMMASHANLLAHPEDILIRVARDWVRYRHGAWSLGARGQLFFRNEESPDELEQRIRTTAPRLGYESASRCYGPYYEIRMMI
ncbi:hypothetical protein BO94DRAFT_548054 [Aspergillus sclerotioniger CBS 115572]|uniref:F-box domain-containing protein n=1 Tax=Aspergillus sclerotioniger CBS 115572 TaxID=1450535 RepID=A0A317W468_9EURO|nr:hypothetical protein BO94DRAFT_548054 [Aspergillus sclerotioniger CBS 115572]PWY80759.1 hypothetical protein BO94DRAFT_548054 [Aspergillus sclerotioniger CBS 115572]